MSTLGDIDPGDFYGSADVARLIFQRSVSWFYSHRRRLIACDGFPRPISSVGQPRWLGDDLLAWVTRPKDRSASNEDIDEGDGQIFDLATALRERAGRVAAGGRRST